MELEEDAAALLLLQLISTSAVTASNSPDGVSGAGGGLAGHVACLSLQGKWVSRREKSWDQFPSAGLLASIPSGS